LKVGQYEKKQMRREARKLLKVDADQEVETPKSTPKLFKKD